MLADGKENMQWVVEEAYLLIWFCINRDCSSFYMILVALSLSMCIWHYIYITYLTNVSLVSCSFIPTIIYRAYLVQRLNSIYMGYFCGMEAKLEKEGMVSKDLRHVVGFAHNRTLDGLHVPRVEKCVLIIQVIVLYFTEADFGEKKGV